MFEQHNLWFIGLGAALLLCAAAAMWFAERRIAGAKRAAAQRMRRLADAAFEGLVVHDGVRVLDVNAPFCALAGESAPALAGRSLTEFIAPESRVSVDEAWCGRRAYPIEARMNTPGGLVDVEVHGRLLDAAGGVYVTAVRDISVRRRAERAERADIAKSEFLANVSHELRTPLHAILDFAETIDQEAAEEVARRGAGRILESGHRLLCLLNDVLDLSKVEAGRMDVNLAPCEVSDVARDVCETLGAAVEARSNRLVMHVENDVGSVPADASRLRQCLLNLVSNANKFTEAGKITLVVRREREHVAVAVSDTGIGMSNEQIGRLFAPFAQPNASISGGDGLGLCIAQRLMQLMGGDLAVHSAPGRGSTFTLLLPRADADAGWALAS